MSLGITVATAVPNLQWLRCFTVELSLLKRRLMSLGITIAMAFNGAVTAVAKAIFEGEYIQEK